MQNLISDARKALADDPRGHLPLDARRRLWRAMSPPFDRSAEPDLGVGRKRRYLLQRAAASKALKLWREVFSNVDQTPHLLELMQVQVERGGQRRELGERYDDGWNQLSELGSKYPLEPAIYAGCAILAAARAALHGVWMGDGRVQSDRELDPEQWDAGFLASCALGEGFPWRAGSQVEVHRAFWSFYLDEASRLWPWGDRADWPVLLESEEGQVCIAPAPADLERVVGALDLRYDRFVVLRRRELHFAQAMRTSGSRFALEIRAGGDDTHNSRQAVNLAEVVRVLADYAEGRDPDPRGWHPAR